jgi:hypothetical protein
MVCGCTLSIIPSYKSQFPANFDKPTNTYETNTLILSLPDRVIVLEHLVLKYYIRLP